MRARFLLKVRQAGFRCLFELSQYGSQASQTAVLRYPHHLIAIYGQWLRAYMDYYKHSGTLPTSLPLPDELRGRSVTSGQASVSPPDRYSQLAQAEAVLLADFHLWLRSPSLHDIRVALARASQQQQDLARPPAELGILCTGEPEDATAAYSENGRLVALREGQDFRAARPYQQQSFDLARLPWESWEINAEFAARGRIQISRIPDGLPEQPPARPRPVRWRRPRILVILGDESGLDFRREEAAMASLRDIAAIRRVRRKSGQHLHRWLRRSTDPDGCRRRRHQYGRYRVRLKSAINDCEPPNFIKGWEASLRPIYSRRSFASLLENSR